MHDGPKSATHDRQLFQPIGPHQCSVTQYVDKGHLTEQQLEVPRDHFKVNEGYGRLQLKQLKLEAQ